MTDILSERNKTKNGDQVDINSLPENSGDNKDIGTCTVPNITSNFSVQLTDTIEDNPKKCYPEASTIDGGDSPCENTVLNLSDEKVNKDAKSTSANENMKIESLDKSPSCSESISTKKVFNSAPTTVSLVRPSRNVLKDMENIQINTNNQSKCEIQPASLNGKDQNKLADHEEKELDSELSNQLHKSNQISKKNISKINRTTRLGHDTHYLGKELASRTFDSTKGDSLDNQDNKLLQHSIISEAMTSDKPQEIVTNSTNCVESNSASLRVKITSPTTGKLSPIKTASEIQTTDSLKPAVKFEESPTKPTIQEYINESLTPHINAKETLTKTMHESHNKENLKSAINVAEESSPNPSTPSFDIKIPAKRHKLSLDGSFSTVFDKTNSSPAAISLTHATNGPDAAVRSRCEDCVKNILKNSLSDNSVLFPISKSLKQKEDAIIAKSMADQLRFIYHLLQMQAADFELKNAVLDSKQLDIVEGIIKVEKNRELLREKSKKLDKKIFKLNEHKKRYNSNRPQSTLNPNVKQSDEQTNA